jgi:hypothetical protein
MTDQPQHVLTKAWKQQLDAGFRIIEAIVEGATKMREKQLGVLASDAGNLDANPG